MVVNYSSGGIKPSWDIYFGGVVGAEKGGGIRTVGEGGGRENGEKKALDFSQLKGFNPPSQEEMGMRGAKGGGKRNFFRDGPDGKRKKGG